MRVYNQDKSQILTNYDLTKGCLRQDKITINQPEIKAVKEEFHYKTIKEYPNGGKDVEKVIDVAGVEYQPAKTYEEEIFVYIPYTAGELAKKQAEKQIYEKKALLKKYKEDVEQVGLFGMTRADYEDKKKACAKLVEELRELEKVVTSIQTDKVL